MNNQLQFDIIENINFAQIPIRKLDSFRKEQPENGLIKRWVYSTQGQDHFRSSITFFSQNESESSDAAISVLKTFLKMGKVGCRYIDCAEVLLNLKGLVDKSKEYGAYLSQLEKLVKFADVVLFNDLPTKLSSGQTEKNLLEILQKRLSTKLPTIIVSPLPLDRSVENSNESEAYLNSILKKTLYIETDKLNTDERALSDFYVMDNNVKTIRNKTTTFADIWAREGLFRMVSKAERATLTKRSEINPKEIIDCDAKEPREFVSWSGFHVVTNGPVVDYDDANVLAAIISIYHECGKAGVVTTTISRLANVMQFKSDSGAVRAQLKRSLLRLSQARLTVRGPKKSENSKTEALWVGGFIDNITYQGEKKTAKVTIKFNDAIAPLYEKDAFSFASIPILVNVSQYAQGIYRFLNSHKDSYKYISLVKWREILGVSQNTKQTSFRDCIGKAIKELIKAQILEENSHIDRNGVFHSYIKRQSPTLVIFH